MAVSNFPSANISFRCHGVMRSKSREVAMFACEVDSGLRIRRSSLIIGIHQSKVSLQSRGSRSRSYAVVTVTWILHSTPLNKARKLEVLAFVNVNTILLRRENYRWKFGAKSQPTLCNSLFPHTSFNGDRRTSHLNVRVRYLGVFFILVPTDIRSYKHWFISWSVATRFSPLLSSLLSRIIRYLIS